MNFFKKIFNKKFKAEDTEDTQSGRRNFMRNSVGTIFSLGLLAGAGNAFAGIKSKTGYIYVKPNGEIINDYMPQDASQPLIGSIMMAGFNFAPINWLLCNGQLVSISENEVLFELIGTTYGGDGVTTFGLPDLRGRIPVHQGQGPGLSNYVLGQSGGAENVTLTVNQIPSHNHALLASTTSGSAASPSGDYIGLNADGIASYGTSSNGNLNTGSIQSQGGSQSHENMQPFLTVNFSIAMYGIFPVQ